MKLKSFLFIAIMSLSFMTIMAQPVKVIFDTDMESDVDDVGALGMLHGLAKNGDAEILATIVCSLNPWSVPTTAAINTFCDRPSFTVGSS